MSSAQAAAELAIFDALTAGVTLAPVYQDVPDNTQAPVVIVAEMSGEPLDAKVDNGSERIALTLTFEDWSTARNPILMIMAEAKGALHNRVLQQDGFTIQPFWQSAEARQVGQSQYFGTMDFIVFAIRD